MGSEKENEMSTTTSNSPQNELNLIQNASNNSPVSNEDDEPVDPLENEENEDEYIILDDYGLSDLESEGSTDDEEEPRKIIPLWAEGDFLRGSMLKQAYDPPDLDAIFAQCE